jgi:hypothetical protein
VNIYVVSDSGQKTADQLLINHLSRITFEARKATPVIVVDDLFNLDQLGSNESAGEHSHFHLDDFLHEKGSIADGVMVVDANQIAKKLNNQTAPWVLFEFGQNDVATCLDFVRKLARFNYMSTSLRPKNIVFSVPSMYLGFFARSLNEAFNNLPCSPIAIQQSGHVDMLFLSTHLEKVFISLPLLTGPLRWVNRLLIFIYQRFVKAA